MLPGLAFLIGAAVFIIAGYQNRNVIDVVLGIRDERETGSPDAGAVTNPTAGAPGLTGSFQQALTGLGTFDGKQVAGWIIPVLTWARRNGWSGNVTSGYRSAADQARVCATGVKPCAAPGTSNHQKKRWPGGAVDVTDWETLRTLVPRYPGPGPTLKWFGAGDPVHFSGNGH